ncbi:hypothetical protein EIB18_01190 [Caulobacter vibrioides]|uniref:Uncharacterized protein n=2 Tax=Caulobacter vibrioides TaxID=155892 RepID=Q9ABJ2_CAUVC|nr:hypothetical protein [Caulobacter vibrioides]YP_002515610.1 hypothetical protein CCNA_00235 [Caulobacter vibrioides NA1000]AAK22222.1 hypothetical protein CC_0235 [Caulobacter vibrioides CB15]ACL93702.1 hypothetical protein CCNA_00235 [Caulobacter vibrioides NA1000]ATC23247.1 hypothetical protein CA608_01205 [Caulobacter vibrioides]ATC27066.1 hypothetical protein CA607_01200 [Caulobacter vibrioides]AZH11454.1 hypothetical protein EIB18_01190 [Caulobacter vibrioides]
MTQRPRQDERAKDVWFEYVLTAGRFSAWPIRWQGWLATALLIVGPITGMMAIAKLAPGVPPFVLVLGAMTVCFGTVFPLAYFKGRPAKSRG